MKKLCILLFLPLSLSAQVNVDSLWMVWKNPEASDSAKALAIRSVTSAVVGHNPDSAKILGKMGVKFCIETKQRDIESDLYKTIGRIHFIQSEFDSTIYYVEKSLEIAKELGNKKAIAGSYGNLGIICDKQGNYTRALDYYQKGLNLFLELKDTLAISMSYSNIGIVYRHLLQMDKAIQYYQLSLEVRKNLPKDRFYATIVNNIGIIQWQEGNYREAIHYFEKALNLAMELKDRRTLSLAVNNIGLVHYDMGNYETADSCYKVSMGIKKEMRDLDGLASSYYNQARSFNKQKKFQKGLEHCLKSYELALELNSPTRMSEACDCMWAAHEGLGNYAEAFKYHREYVLIRDSLTDVDNQNQIARLEVQFEYRGKIQADSIKNAEAQKIKDAQIAKQELEIENQRKEQYMLFGGLGFVLVFTIFLYNRYKVIKSQKIIIEEQKEEVETQRDLIEEQKAVVEEAHHEIKESINYAKRIQTAILPPDDLIAECLPQSFIIYQPKDVVAGDFYWIEKVGDKVLFAAADCTGHGVPGAMVSVVCHNAMNRAVREYKCTLPNAILDKTRELVLEELAKNNQEVRDGMDIALCLRDGNKLYYAGAHNPLWIVRNGELLETKADKQPIGKFDGAQPFYNHELTLEKGDSIYVFSDGYIDQFGGDKDKKFGSRRLKELLLSIQDQPMEDQKDTLEKTLHDWMLTGEAAQLDDVCMIGIRV